MRLQAEGYLDAFSLQLETSEFMTQQEYYWEVMPVLVDNYYWKIKAPGNLADRQA